MNLSKIEPLSAARRMHHLQRPSVVQVLYRVLTLTGAFS
jgi:hypothetical protein